MPLIDARGEEPKNESALFVTVHNLVSILKGDFLAHALFKTRTSLYLFALYYKSIIRISCITDLHIDLE